jgi:Putative inner membrane protein (DUF1819)
MMLLLPDPLTSNIQKGGALLDDCRRVVEAWENDRTPEENLARIADENLLAKASRARTEDVLLRVIRPRLVAPGRHVIPALKGLLTEPRAFTEACYYEAARDDSLLAAFAEGPLWSWWQAGRVGVGIDDVTSWLGALAKEGRIPAWSDSVRTKAARGLLAALRDFGVLRGATRKEIAPPAMSPQGFAYVAWREHEQGASSRALATSRVWRRWLLEPDRVADLFAHAARLGVLRFSSAGSAVRVDWLTGSLAEVTGAAA